VVAPVVRASPHQNLVDELCNGRCHTCGEGLPYTKRSLDEGTYLFHAVGEAQVPCDARDLRVLASTLLAEISRLKIQAREAEQEGREAARDAAAEATWRERERHEHG
jgi:hypothetical protein